MQQTVFIGFVALSVLLSAVIANPIQSDQERHLRLQILQMIQNNDFGGIEALARKIRNDKQKAKMEKCMEMFQSYAICTQTTSFYLWAQMLARDIMNDGQSKTAEETN